MYKSKWASIVIRNEIMIVIRKLSFKFVLIMFLDPFHCVHIIKQSSIAIVIVLQMGYPVLY